MLRKRRGQTQRECAYTRFVYACIPRETRGPLYHVLLLRLFTAILKPIKSLKHAALAQVQRQRQQRSPPVTQWHGGPDNWVS